MGLGLENPLHIAIVLLVVLLVFGAKKLPEIGRGIGSGMREFKDSVTGKDVEPNATSVSAQLEDSSRVPEA